MEAVVALTGQGGWPLTVFLTPDGRPFWGGTYFPPEQRHGLPSFRQVLTAISEAYRERGGDLERQADALTDAIRDAGRRPPSSEPLTTGLLTGAASSLAESFDPEWGGFGGAPKFPPASTLEFLLRMAHGHGDERALAMTRATLDGMAAGGMYDLVGGGFHRYSVDAVLARPPLREDALRQRAPRDRVPARLGRHRRGALPPRRRGDARLRAPRAAPAGGRLRVGAGRGHGRRGRADLHVDARPRSRRCSAERHDDWLLPFEGGRFVLRGEIPAEDRARTARGARPAAAARTRRQGARSLERPRAVRVRRGGPSARARGLPRRRTRARRVPAGPALGRARAPVPELPRRHGEDRRVPGRLRGGRGRAARAVRGDRRAALARGGAPAGAARGRPLRGRAARRVLPRRA